MHFDRVIFYLILKKLSKNFLIKFSLTSKSFKKNCGKFAVLKPMVYKCFLHNLKQLDISIDNFGVCGQLSNQKVQNETHFFFMLHWMNKREATIKV